MPTVRLFAILAALFFTSPMAISTAPRGRHAAERVSLTAQSAPLSPAALQVARVRDQWTKFLNAKQLGPLMTLYAPDAVMLQPNGQRVSGAPSIRVLTQKIWVTLTPDISMHGVTTKVSCDMAYDQGDFRETLTPVASGAKQESQGSYLMIFKRDRSGRWLIIQQVWTGTEPKL